MKKLYITLSFCVFGLASIAQTGHNAKPFNCAIKPGNLNTQAPVIDTVWNYMNRASGFWYYGAPEGGYIHGTGYDMPIPTITTPISEECGNHYDGFGGNLMVTELLVLFGAKDDGSAETLEGRFYDCNPDSTPNNQLGSGTILTTAVDTGGFLTSIAITPSAGTSGDFFVSVNYSNLTNDTIGITTNDAANNEGLGERRTKLYNGTVMTWFDASDPALYGLDADAMILPIIDYSAGNAEVDFEGLKLNTPYPNPAVNSVTLPFQLDNEQEVRVQVFDLSTRVLFDTGDLSYASGTNQVVIDTDEFAAGSYYFNVMTGGRTFTSKFVVTE